MSKDQSNFVVGSDGTVTYQPPVTQAGTTVGGTPTATNAWQYTMPNSSAQPTLPPNGGYLMNNYNVAPWAYNGYASGPFANNQFNPTWYSQQNPDVASAVAAGDFANPYEHYVMYGRSEGRLPNSGMNSAWTYNNPSTAAPNTNPYATSGAPYIPPIGTGPFSYGQGVTGFYNPYQMANAGSGLNYNDAFNNARWNAWQNYSSQSNIYNNPAGANPGGQVIPAEATADTSPGSPFANQQTYHGNTAGWQRSDTDVNRGGVAPYTYQMNPGTTVDNPNNVARFMQQRRASDAVDRPNEAERFLQMTPEQRLALQRRAPATYPEIEQQAMRLAGWDAYNAFRGSDAGKGMSQLNNMLSAGAYDPHALARVFDYSDYGAPRDIGNGLGGPSLDQTPNMDMLNYLGLNDWWGSRPMYSQFRDTTGDLLYDQFKAAQNNWYNTAYDAIRNKTSDPNWQNNYVQTYAPDAYNFWNTLPQG